METLASSQSQSRPEIPAKLRPSKRGGTKEPLLASSDSDEKSAIKLSKEKSRARSQSVKPDSTQSKHTTRGRPGSQRQPLFIDSDEDDKDDDVDLSSAGRVVDELDDEDETGATLRSTGRATRARKGKEKDAGMKRMKTPAVVVDDDSDDGATFKAFGARRGTRR